MEIMSSVQSESRASRAKIIDVREQRLMAQGLEIREDGKADQFVLEGYAATFEAYDCYGGVERGGWIEQIDPKAFDKTLRNSPDVQLLINHEGLMLARTTSGTLSLSVDNKGLKVRAHLDRNDPDVQRIAPKMKRGDLNEMSFAFRVLNQRWDNNYEHRLITEVSLQRGDVSIVSYGMNPDTHAVLTEQAVGALARMSMDDLAELRSLAPEKLEAAIRVLTRAKDDSADSSGFSPPSGVRAEAKRALEWIKDGKAGGGFTDVGRKRASDLAAGRSVGRDTIGRIANYLARHEGDKKGEGWSPGDSGYPSPGRVAWAAWGGDPAKSWTKSIIDADDSSRTEYSLPYVSTLGTRAELDGGSPQPNGQAVSEIDHEEEDTTPADMSGSQFQSGMDDKPVVTKTGASNTPVKMEIDPVNGVTNISRINTPIMKALVKSLESTINNACMVAESNNDSSRALVAEAAEQITKIREDLSDLPKPETDIERKLKQLSSGADEKNPFAADEGDDDDEEDVTDTADEEKTDKVEPAKRSAEEVMEDEDEDETEEDETEEEEETPPGMGAGFSVARALKELQEGAGVPVIESVSDGLEYFKSIKRG